MNERVVELIIRAKNAMQAGLTQAAKQLNDFKVAAQKAADAANQSFENAARSVKRFGREIQKLGRDMIQIGAVITAPFALAVKNMEKYSSGVAQQTGRIADAFNQMQMTIANALIPVLKTLADFFGRVSNALNAIDPQVRNNIIQFTAWTGIILTVGGAVLALAGSIIKLGAEVVLLMIKMAPFIAIILSVVAAVALLAYAWKNHHDIFTKAMNGIEALGNIVFGGMVKQLEIVIAVLAKLMNSFANTLQFLGAKTKNSVLSRWGDDAKVLANNLDKTAKSLKSMSSGAFNKAGNLASGQGGVSQSIDQFMATFTNGFKKAQDAFNSFSPNVNKLTADLGLRLKGAAESFSDGLVDAFDRATFEGKNFAEEMKSLLSNVARDFLKDMVKAQLKNAIGSAFQNGGFNPLSLFGAGSNAANGAGLPLSGGGQQGGGAGGLANIFSGLMGSTKQASQAMTNTAQTTQKTATAMQNAAGSTQSASAGMMSLGQIGLAMAAGFAGTQLAQAVTGGKGLAGQKGKFGTLGALGGAALGFMVGGPVGAIVGAGLGGFAGGLFHAGGRVHAGIPAMKRADFGMDVRGNDRLIMAQTGEGVISRQGMNQLGSDGLARLNRGEGVDGDSGKSVNIYHINAVDSKSFIDMLNNHGAAVTKLVSKSIRKNSGLRKDIKEYA